MLKIKLCYGKCGRGCESSRIRSLRMNNLRAIIGVKRGNRIRNERFRELVPVCKRVDGVINESTILSHEKKDGTMMVNSVFKGELSVRRVDRSRRKLIKGVRRI